MLTEDKKTQLDSIVQKMSQNKESDSNIQAVVNDFKSMYSSPDTTATPAKPDKVGDFIASQGSVKEQRQKINAGEASTVGSAFSGAPIAPASKEDVNAMSKDFNPLKVVGKTLVNTVSDLPSIVKGAADMVIHPIDSVKGMAQYYAGIATETFGAIKEAIKTGDMTRIQEDIQKATIAMVDHPLQTIAAFEGGKAIAKGGAGIIKDPVGAATKGADATISAVDKGKEIFNSAKEKFSSKGVSFATDSALHKKTVEVADNIGQQVEAQKKVANLQKELDSMTTKVTEKSKQKAGQIQEKTLEQNQKELELNQAKRELADMGKIHKEQVKEVSDSTKSEFSANSFPSLKTMQNSVKDFFTTAKDKIGKGYEENLGNAPVDLGKVFSGIDKFQSYLRGISDKKTLSAIEPFVENLKMRDLTTRFAGDEKGLVNELAKKGIPYDENFTKEYPPLTSANIKGTRNVIEESIRQNNKDALKNYDSNVNSGFKESFRDAIKSEYGEEKLARLDETDKKWSELMSNPLMGEDTPSLDSIQKNWDAFTKNANQLPEGKSLIEKIQNYTGEQILENARQSSGEYSPSVINTGIKKYGNIMGEDIKAKLQGVVDLNNTLKQSMETKKEEVVTKKEEVTSTTEDIKKLNEEQKKITQDVKSIGKTPSEVISKIKDLKSIDELNSFLDKSGKTIEEVRPAIMQAIIEKADPKLLEDKTAPFDVTKTPEIIKELKELGKSEDGTAWKQVNDELLGKDGIKAVKDLETKYAEYEKLTTTKGKSRATRIIEGAFGTILIAFGHFIWGGLEVIRAAKSGAKDKESISGRERPTPAPAPKPKKPIVTKGRVITSGVNAAQESNQDTNEQ